MILARGYGFTEQLVDGKTRALKVGAWNGMILGIWSFFIVFGALLAFRLVGALVKLAAYTNVAIILALIILVAVR